MPHIITAARHVLPPPYIPSEIVSYLDISHLTDVWVTIGVFPQGNLSEATLYKWYLVCWTTRWEQCLQPQDDIVPEGLHWVCRPAYRAPFIILHDTPSLPPPLFWGGGGYKSRLHAWPRRQHFPTIYNMPGPVTLYFLTKKVQRPSREVD